MMLSVCRRQCQIPSRVGMCRLRCCKVSLERLARCFECSVFEKLWSRGGKCVTGECRGLCIIVMLL